MTQTKRNPEQDGRLAYGIDELKQMLGVSRDTVLRMIAKGELERVKAQSRILITKTSVDKFLAGGR